MEKDKDSSKPKYTFSTLAIHADRDIEPQISDVAPPIHMSTTFEKPNEQHLSYSRVDQPTRRRVEEILGALECTGELPAVTYATGMAATFAVLHAIKPKRVLIREGYWQSHQAVELYFGQDQVAEKKKKLEDDTEVTVGDLIWLETPNNPRCELFDIKAWSDKARAVGAFVAVDSTFATPVLQRPLELGAHIVMHSCTKFLGGHSDLLGGVVATRNHGLFSVLRNQRMILGSVMGNLETYLLLRSLRSLKVRVKRQSRSATKIAKWLATQTDKVSKVWHPDLPEHPNQEVYKAQMKGGPPCFSFEMHTPEEASHLPYKLKLITNATSLGGVESLIDYRFQYDSNVSPCLLRISIGLESAKDLIADLHQAFHSESLPSSPKMSGKKGYSNSNDEKSKKDKKDKKRCSID